MSSYSTVRGSVVDVPFGIPIVEEVPEVLLRQTLVNTQRKKRMVGLVVPPK